MTNIKHEMANGVMWTAFAKYSGIIVSILVSMVLARILTPDDYGVVAISTVLMTFLTMFSRMGIGPAVIQRRDLSPTDLNNIFSFTCYVGAILSVLFYLASWPIAYIYGNTLLISICKILSITLFFGSMNMVPDALMMQNKRFKQSAIRTVVLNSCSGVISIIAAFSGLGVYSLLITPVFTSIGIFFYNWSFYPVRFVKNFSFSSIKKIASYSSYQLLFELSNYFFRNSDKLIIGKYLSAASLGYYEKSYRLMQMPSQNVTGVIHPVLQPILSQFQDNFKEMTNKYNKVISLVSMISFPVSVILYFNATDIILIMFGDQWKPAVPVFQIMVLSIPLQMITSTSGAVFQASNGTKQLFISGAISSVITIISFLIGAIVFCSIEAVAWGWTISSFMSFIVSFYILYYYVFRSSPYLMLKTLINPFFGAVLIAIAYTILSFTNMNMNAFIRLIVKLLYGVFICLIYLEFTGRFSTIIFIKSKLKK